METINVSMVNGWLNARRYGGKVVDALRAAVTQPAENRDVSPTKAAHEAVVRKEQRQAEAMAQLQSARLFR